MPDAEFGLTQDAPSEATDEIQGEQRYSSVAQSPRFPPIAEGDEAGLDGLDGIPPVLLGSLYVA